MKSALIHTAITLSIAILMAPSGVTAPVESATEKPYDYFLANRIMIRNGLQAVLTCNGIFTSNRSIEQVFDQELAYVTHPVGTAQGGAYVVDRNHKYAAVGGGEHGPEIRAAFREGIGCVVMAPAQDIDDIDRLPILPTDIDYEALATTPWPDGDFIEHSPDWNSIDRDALNRASQWAFERENPEQDTLSLIVVHKGQIVHEKYANGINQHTKTRTWSTAKSIASTLLGILVEQGKMTLDEPLSLSWKPTVPAAEQDPRLNITLRHVLNMSSGLYPVDSFGMEYATGSGLAYWAGASSVEGALNRGLIRTPGTFFDYENYDTLLAVKAMRNALKTTDKYHSFPGDALLKKIGMHNTLLSTDRFGDFILSSQVYTNARDLARFGLLYAQQGRWHGEQVVSEDWIDFVRTPAPASNVRQHDYGGHWWLVPDTRTDVPADAYSTAGNRGQYAIVVPSHDLVIVRRGLDYGRQGFNRWDLTREVLKAFPRS